MKFIVFNKGLGHNKDSMPLKKRRCVLNENSQISYSSSNYNIKALRLCESQLFDTHRLSRELVVQSELVDKLTNRAHLLSN